MLIETQKSELINGLKNYSDEDLAEIAFHVWIEQQERLQADQIALVQFATDQHLAKGGIHES